MELSHVFSLARWRSRFSSERQVVAQARAEHRAPDATVDEVGAAADNEGFDGHPLKSRGGSGYGTGDPGGPGWAGWGA